MKKTQTLSSTVVRRAFGTYLNRVDLLGEEIIVKRDGKSLARLVPLQAVQTNQQHTQGITQPEGKFDFRTSAGIISTTLPQSPTDKKTQLSETMQESRRLETELRANQHLFLDTPIIECFWRKSHKHHHKIVQLFDAVYDLGIQCIISYVSYIELISQCIATDHKLAAKLRGYLSNSHYICLYPIDHTVADRSALHTTKSPEITLDDSSKIAIAEIAGADFILTDKQSWKKIKGENVVLIDELKFGRDNLSK